MHPSVDLLVLRLLLETAHADARFDERFGGARRAAGDCYHPREGQPDPLRLDCKNIFAAD